jgi:hypothetical protein
VRDPMWPGDDDRRRQAGAFQAPARGALVNHGRGGSGVSAPAEAPAS